MVDYPGAPPTEWDCRVFIKVVEKGQLSKAAASLAELHPRGTYSRQAVSDVLAKIAAWSPQQLLEKNKDGVHWPTTAGAQFLESARHVVAEYRLMRDDLPRQNLPTLACLPHHLYVVNNAEEILANRVDAPSSTMQVQVMEQGHRHEIALHRSLAERLSAGRYEWVIGPWFEDQKTFRSEPLYSTRLEAMVPAKWRCAGGLSLTDLVQDSELILPPPDTQSRRLLEQAIKDWGIVDDRRRMRIVDESAETWSGVLRLRLQLQSASSAAQNRVLVASSDVALAFRPGMEFGGRGAASFRWVPLYHDVVTEGARTYLQYEVFLTSRRSSGQDNADVVREALSTAAKDMEARFHLADDPVPPKQRPAPPGAGARSPRKR